MKVDVLDKGFVHLVSHTPHSDLLVVNAARCSFDKEHKRFDPEKDTKLISYLAKHKHLLPFRHPQITLRIKMPLFVAAQMKKHQVGFSQSEVSRRYIKSEPEFYNPEGWRYAADSVKQGSMDETLTGKWGHEAAHISDRSHQEALLQYGKLLELGVAPEQARMVLPQSLYTTIMFTGSLLGWFSMWDQRTEKSAQWEIQEYARAIGSIVYPIAPMSWLELGNHARNFGEEDK